MTDVSSKSSQKWENGKYCEQSSQMIPHLHCFQFKTQHCVWDIYSCTLVCNLDLPEKRHSSLIYRIPSSGGKYHYYPSMHSKVLSWMQCPDSFLHGICTCELSSLINICILNNIHVYNNSLVIHIQIICNNLIQSLLISRVHRFTSEVCSL